MDIGLKITKELLKYPVDIAKVIVMLSFFMNLFMKGSEHLNTNPVETFISLIKCLGYGVLAWFIYVNTNELEQIDVLTYFTFLLACIEVGHNFANSIGNWMVAVIKILFNR